MEKMGGDKVEKSQGKMRFYFIFSFFAFSITDTALANHLAAYFTVLN